MKEQREMTITKRFMKELDRIYRIASREDNTSLMRVIKSIQLGFIKVDRNKTTEDYKNEIMDWFRRLPAMQETMYYNSFEVKRLIQFCSERFHYYDHWEVDEASTTASKLLAKLSHYYDHWEVDEAACQDGRYAELLEILKNMVLEIAEKRERHHVSEETYTQAQRILFLAENKPGGRTGQSILNFVATNWENLRYIPNIYRLLELTFSFEVLADFDESKVCELTQILNDLEGIVQREKESEERYRQWEQRIRERRENRMMKANNHGNAPAEKEVEDMKDMNRENQKRKGEETCMDTTVLNNEKDSIRKSLEAAYRIAIGNGSREAEDVLLYLLMGLEEEVPESRKMKDEILEALRKMKVLAFTRDHNRHDDAVDGMYCLIESLRINLKTRQLRVEDEAMQDGRLQEFIKQAQILAVKERKAGYEMFDETEEWNEKERKELAKLELSLVELSLPSAKELNLLSFNEAIGTIYELLWRRWSSYEWSQLPYELLESIIALYSEDHFHSYRNGMLPDAREISWALRVLGEIRVPDEAYEAYRKYLEKAGEDAANE